MNKIPNFSPYYQPQININTKTLYGFEILTRFQDLNYKLNTYDVINDIQKNKMGHLFTTKLLKKVFLDLDSISQKNIPNIAINISSTEIENNDYFTFIINVLEEKESYLNKLEFEITENCKIKNPKIFLENIKLLKTKGVKIALDDLEKGFNTLDLIDKYPFDKIKLDKKLVSNWSSNEINLKNIINYIHNLNMLVVAEGIENIETLNKMISLKCDIVQGFYIGKPCPFNELKISEYTLNDDLIIFK
ncbi:EAL domain-containing protein [Clostridium perfringens]|nr:EAL domain-containing protein [Clostridium perfringens]